MSTQVLFVIIGLVLLVMAGAWLRQRMGRRKLVCLGACKIFCTRGKTYAKVLPEPVGATSTRRFPFCSVCRISAWIFQMGSVVGAGMKEGAQVMAQRGQCQREARAHAIRTDVIPGLTALLPFWVHFRP